MEMVGHRQILQRKSRSSQWLVVSPWIRVNSDGVSDKVAASGHLLHDETIVHSYTTVGLLCDVRVCRRSSMVNEWKVCRFRVAQLSSCQEVAVNQS